jgi:hypothetical protein
MPHYVYYVTRKPSRDGSDPGAIEEGWFEIIGAEVVMTTQGGEPLPGNRNRRKPRSNQTPKDCARDMLKAKVMSRPMSNFNRPLGHRHYFNMGKI